jgi:hypothetical protein
MNPSQQTLLSQTSSQSTLWRGVIPAVSHLSQRDEQVEEQVTMFGRKRLTGKGAMGGGATSDVDALREFT